MSELSEIRRAGREAAASGEPLWLATVMRVRGSAYRHGGARLLFTTGRALAGSVSGGCLEASIVRKGPWLTREHPACIYFEGAREDEHEGASKVGTGCDGTVDILVERVLTGDNVDPLVLIDECLAAQRRGVLVTVFESSDARLPIGCRLSVCEGGALRTSIPNADVSSELASLAEQALRDPRAKCRTVSGEHFEALLEIIEPAPYLFVIGSGPDAVKVVDFAHALGLGVTVCDTSGRLSARERFSKNTELHVGSVASVGPLLAARRTALAVVMSHDYSTDLQALELLLDSRAEYIGMLGPARRTARMLSELGHDKSNLSARDRARLKAPVGLDLGAETPTQIALSIVSEIQALLGHANAEPLSRRARPIHAPNTGLTLEAARPWARTGST